LKDNEMGGIWKRLWNTRRTQLYTK
jgi:hypothetical protein